MSDQNNIDPLQDIDFESMGVMTKFDAGNEPNTPPAEDPPAAGPAQPDPKDPMNPDPATPPETDDDPPAPAGEDPKDPKAPEAPDEGGDPAPDGDDPQPDPEPGVDPAEGTDPPDDPGELPSVASELIDLVGYSELDAEAYDDSVEGLGKLVSDASTKLAEQQLQATFSQYPAVEEFYEYVAQGGDPDRYHTVRGQAVDYESMQIEDDNEAQQESITRQYLKAGEYEDAKIDAMIEKYKASGILADQAEISLEGLKRQAAKKKQSLLETQQQTAAEQQKEITKFWGEVEQTLRTQDEFKGLQIPKKEIDPFFAYISEPVKDGYSQRDLDALELGLEEKIALDYLIYSKFPFSEIIDKKAASKNAGDLRKRIKSGGDPKPRKTPPPKPAGQGGQPAVTDLDLI